MPDQTLIPPATASPPVGVGPPPPCDGDLVAAIARGDVDALATLYDRYCGGVQRLALRRLRDREAAEDLVQDGFLSLWRGAGDYRPSRGTVRAWLMAIVNNHAVDHLRRRSAQVRRQGMLEDLYEGHLGDVVSRAAIDRVAAQAARADRIALPAAQREALLLFLAGFSQSEIADSLDIPLGTVKSRMRLGLVRMRRALGDPSPGGDTGPEADARV